MPMLTDDAYANLNAFCDRKTVQGLAAMAVLPGVSLIASGERQSQIVISIANESLAEAVIIGQLPHVHLKLSGSPRNPVARDAPNDLKPVEKQAIDLSDAEIAAVLECWRNGRSALGLVPHVYDAKGKLKLI